MIVPISVAPDKFFSIYLTLLDPILNLRPAEAKVLEAFLVLHYRHRNNPRVNQLVFSRSGLKIMREYTGMTINAFNYNKCNLRKKNMLGRLSINESLTKHYPKEGKLTIGFVLNIKPKASIKQ